MLKINLFFLLSLIPILTLLPPQTGIKVRRGKTNAVHKTIVLPLKMAGNLILVDATVDGVFGTFVFDTGAQGIVLNATYFRDGKKSFDSPSNGITSLNIEKQSRKIDLFEMNGYRMKNIWADVIDLGHIENSRNIKIHGLIGASIMRNFETTIDIQNLRITMRPVDRKGNLIEQYSDTIPYNVVQKIYYTRNVIMTTIPINGKNTPFCLDTGAEHNVLDYNCHRKVMETISITNRKILRGAGDERIEVLYGLMNDFSIHNVQFDQMHTVLTDMTSLRDGYGVKVSGMLGYDFFSQGVIKLNFKKRTMHIAVYKRS